MTDADTTGTSSSTDSTKTVEYADPVSLQQLHQTITTSLEDLWQQNEELFVWLLQQMMNALLRTVPGGGKTYVKETVVPKLAYETDRTFVLATTEYRNRQATYEEVLETLIDCDLVGEVNVVYVPSPRERYGNIPKLVSNGDGEPKVTTPDEKQAVCQTFTTDSDDEFVYSTAKEMNQYISSGATTGAIHDAVTSEWGQTKCEPDVDYSQSILLCQRIGVERGHDPANPNGEPACRYRRLMQRRLNQIKTGNADIVICGASLLNMPEVVEGTTVIADEDVSGELVKTYSEAYLEDATENFLSTIEVGPDGYRGALRADDAVKANVAKYIRENYAPRSDLGEDDDRDPLVNRNAPIKSDSYEYDRAEAPLLTLALIEGTDTENTNHIVFDQDAIPYSVVIDLESNNANNSHDAVAIASPPQPLQAAEQVIALDATGPEAWWELLTGVTFESVSPNPLDERGQVVTEAFDIQFRQLTKKMVPISRPNNLSPREFLGILQAIVTYHDADEVSVVTSKAMRDKVLDSEYADEVIELAYADEILHFGGLRSDRTFGESQLHIVIGAPHPGDDAVRQRMALLGYDDEIVQNNYAIRGEDRYKGRAETVLRNLVYSEVYQAARRAARNADRDDTAYAYLYSRMFDADLLPADDSFRINIFGREEQCQNGTETLLTVLDQADTPLRTKTVVKRVNDQLEDQLAYRTVIEKLNEMADNDVIKKGDWIKNEKRWELDGPVRHGTLLKENAGRESI
jgi:hypothetical protein